MVALERASVATLMLALGACAVPYQPCPVEVPGPLPPQAFTVCRDLLLAEFGELAMAQAEPLRLQSDWCEQPRDACERRAMVFETQGELAVVVQARWLREPWFGMPGWSGERADPAAERQLADRLRAALSSH